MRTPGKAGYWLAWGILLGMLAGAIFFFVWLALDKALCSDTGGNCVRVWMEASSGWAGFAAAVVGAFLVLGQLNEQQKQTAFLIGDGAATAEIYTYAMDGQRAVFRIINWNRRILSIGSIEIACQAGLLPLATAVEYRMGPGNAEHISKKDRRPIKIDFKEEPANTKRKGRTLCYTFAIDGWLNRQTSPNFVDLEFNFPGDNDGFQDHLKNFGQSDTACVTFHGEHDESGQKVTLSATIPVAHFLPRISDRKKSL